MQVSERIRELRKERGWTQFDLSEHTGIAQSSISTIERTVDAFQRADDLTIVAEAFGMTLDELRASAREADRAHFIERVGEIVGQIARDDPAGGPALREQWHAVRERLRALDGSSDLPQRRPEPRPRRRRIRGG